MSQPIDPNKVSEKERRRAARIKEKLIHSGIGEDEAEKQSLRQAVEEMESGEGGGTNAGG